MNTLWGDISHATWATLIAAISLLVSVWTMWRQRRLQGRAHFTAAWESNNSITYVNHGPGPAKRLRVELAVGSDHIEREYPFVGSFQRMRVGWVPRHAQAPPQALQVSWNDNRLRRQRALLFLPDRPPHQPKAPTPGAMDDQVRAVAQDVAREEIEADARWRQDQGYS